MNSGMRIHGESEKYHQAPADDTDCIYYGWVIVAVGAILLGVSFGICYSFGVFLSSLQTEFSINRAAVSSIFSLYLFLVGIFSIWGGRFCDRFGPRIVVMGIIASIPSRLISGFMADRMEKRKVIIGFALLIAISMLWLSWADQMWKFYR